MDYIFYPSFNLLRIPVQSSALSVGLSRLFSLNGNPTIMKIEKVQFLPHGSLHSLQSRLRPLLTVVTRPEGMRNGTGRRETRRDGASQGTTAPHCHSSLVVLSPLHTRRRREPKALRDGVRDEGRSFGSLRSDASDEGTE